MHPCQAFPANQDHFPLANASLPEFSRISRSLFPRKCIPEQTFLQIRITFPSQMHPCQNFPAYQDHFPLTNASLPDLSCKSGSLSPRKCIPARPFLQIRITFPLENASMPDLSCISGSLFPCKCIPARIFPHIRITSHKQMHPCQTFPANQDHFPLANASLNRLSCKSGSLLTSKCIPARLFLQIRITSHKQNCAGISTGNNCRRYSTSSQSPVR